MLGNDIVDLGDPECRAAGLHPRFDARVLTPEERSALRESDAPARLRWVFWAAKEAAYKALRRSDASLGFAPAQFAVRRLSEHAAEVRHAGARLDCRLHVVGDALHAWVLGGGAVRRVCTGIAERAEEEDASAAVRRFARRRIAAALGVVEDDLRFERRGRVPDLRVGEARLALSLSHHGRFVAFACGLEASA